MYSLVSFEFIYYLLYVDWWICLDPTRPPRQIIDDYTPNRLNMECVDTESQAREDRSMID